MSKIDRVEKELRQRKILLVTSDKAILSIIRRVIDTMGCELLSANNYQDALSNFQKVIVDIVIIDSSLENETAFDICSEIRASEYSLFTPVLLIADPDDDSRLEKAYQSGITDYIFNPVTESTLRHRLRCIKQSIDNTSTLRADGEKFALMANNIKEVLWMCSADGQRVLYVSPAYEHIWGRKTQDLYNHPEYWLDDIHQDDRERIMIAFTEKATQANDYTEEYRIVRPDGQIRWVRDHGFPVYDQAGKHNAIAGTVMDITGQKEIEGSLRLAHKLEAIGRLSAGIAHEINTPAQYVGDNLRFLEESLPNLLSINGNLTSLMQAVFEDKETVTKTMLSDLFDLIEKADMEYLIEEIPIAISQSLNGMKSISEIVCAMKEFTHPGTDNKELTDVNAMIKNTIIVSKNEWKYVADVKENFETNLPLVPSHTQMLGQAVLNLIVNAAHAIEEVINKEVDERGQISVSTRLLQDKVEISISDTGPGIPDKIKEQIFDPFFTTKEVGKGTGQGLSLVRKAIVEHHGGTLDIDTQLGKGTTFIIRLPLQDNKN